MIGAIGQEELHVRGRLTGKIIHDSIDVLIWKFDQGLLDLGGFRNVLHRQFPTVFDVLSKVVVEIGVGKVKGGLIARIIDIVPAVSLLKFRINRDVYSCAGRSTRA